MFLQHCPEFIIVDEAHTCAKPKGANKSQQLRHALLSDLSKSERHIVLLTATPHSGNNEEFQSLIGLLKPEFEHFTLEDARQREELSHYFIQRRRADVKPYVGNDMIFPTRVQFDAKYELSAQYHALLMNIIDYVREGVKAARSLGKIKQRYIYWDLLALIRGVMSSPDAGISMLQNKINKRSNDSENVAEDNDKIYKFNDALKDGLFNDDVIPESYEESSNSEKNKFRSFISILREIKEKGQDSKVTELAKNVEFALNSGYAPIVFCQYIQTAEYCKDYIAKHLSGNKKYKDVSVEVITSRLTDEDRKMKIEELAKAPRHVLVCTDCLSEGVNLQTGFNCVIHYDLPWNPNRMEQRNGRIDRFGQTEKEVAIFTLFDEDTNPVDKIIMKVLYRKQNQIRKSLGIYIPIADNDSTLMESIMEEIIVLDTKKEFIKQPTLFDMEWASETVEEHDKRIQRAVEIEKKSHTYFAHNTKAMDPTRLIESLNAAGDAVGGISFGSDGRMWFDGDMYHQGTKDNRSLRFYTSDLWCRGVFGARERSIMVVYGSYAYVYTKGADKTGTYIPLTSGTSSANETYYTVPCYSPRYDYNGETSGFPVDTVIFRITSNVTYRYLLSLAVTQRIFVVNANDNYNNVQIYANGTKQTLNGGSMHHCMQLVDFMYPSPNSDWLGRGLMFGASNDNDWK